MRRKGGAKVKLLVLSDSHSALRFMRRCIDVLRPDAVVHLGDYYDDGRAMAEEYPQIPFYQVPGNCDRYRCPPDQAQTLRLTLGGVQLFLTHGHLQGVKMSRCRLLHEARQWEVQAVLYGHTHHPDCHQEADGVWVLNPGSCGYDSSAGLIEIQNAKITGCRILRQGELEDIK